VADWNSFGCDEGGEFVVALRGEVHVRRGLVFIDELEDAPAGFIDVRNLGGVALLLSYQSMK